MPELANVGMRSKCGFATTQQAYENNIKPLFSSLDKVEKQLQSSKGPYWFGDQLTEVDIRLFPTIIRFDPVYVQHFKTNIRDIRSGYPAIHKWLRHLYWDVPAFHDTTQFEHIKKHYTKSHTQINQFVSLESFLGGMTIAKHLTLFHRALLPWDRCQIFCQKMRKSQPHKLSSENLHRTCHRSSLMHVEELGRVLWDQVKMSQ